MARGLAYRRILVPVRDNRESEQAMDVASRLAGEHGAAITAVAVVVVPPLLPFDAHMASEEQAAHRLLERAGAVADSYGVDIHPRVVRGREPAAAILGESENTAAELIVIGAPRRGTSAKGPRVFGSTVEHVLKHARCRVLVIGSRPVAARASAAAA
ncbi:MAG TPA: universal stress protein [Gaiellaceae bacterium]